MAAQQHYVKDAEDGRADRGNHLFEGSAFEHRGGERGHREEKQYEKRVAQLIKIEGYEERGGGGKAYDHIRLHVALARQPPELVEPRRHGEDCQRNEERPEPRDENGSDDERQGYESGDDAFHYLE
jgi:hypothetical protein